MMIIAGIPSINLDFRVLCRIISIVVSIATLPPTALTASSITSGILARFMYFDANLSYAVIKNATADIIKKYTIFTFLNY